MALLIRTSLAGLVFIEMVLVTKYPVQGSMLPKALGYILSGIKDEVATFLPDFATAQQKISGRFSFSSDCILIGIRLFLIAS